MTEELQAETGRVLVHGQHHNRFYWVGGTVLFTIGMICGYFLAPDEFSLLRKLAAGGMFGLLSGYCVFAWHMLFYNTVEA